MTAPIPATAITIHTHFEGEGFSFCWERSVSSGNGVDAEGVTLSVVTIPCASVTVGDGLDGTVGVPSGGVGLDGTALVDAGGLVGVTVGFGVALFVGSVVALPVEAAEGVASGFVDGAGVGFFVGVGAGVCSGEAGR